MKGKRFGVVFLFLLICGCWAEPSREENKVSRKPAAPDRQPKSLKLIHPEFDFTSGNFSTRLTDLTSEVLEDPAGFLELAAGMLEMPAAYLTLVDKNHLLAESYVPGDTVGLELYSCIAQGRPGLVLDRRAAEALQAMSEAAAREGIQLTVSSAYRSYEYQKSLFQRYADSDGEDAAARYSARPGSSQHQLGTAVDLGDISNRFSGEPAGLWMAENAGRYGWSLSYPDGMEAVTGYGWESWHWRWIGTDAVMMQNRYFGGVQQLLLEFWDKNASPVREAMKRE